MSYRRLAMNLALAAVYFGAAKLGLQLAFVNASASAVWPPTGVAIAALLLLGPRAWPGVFIGAFIANLTTAGTIATSLAIAAGNTLEGVAGAWLVRRYANGLDAFTRTVSIFRFVFLAGLFAPTISATIGVSSLGLGGLMPWGAFGAVWLTWWLGDAVGAVVVAPFLVLWGRRQGWRAILRRAELPNGRTWLEAALLVLTLMLVGWIVFGTANNEPLEFICIPVLIWAAFRFGPRAAATIALLLSAMAIWGTLHAQGPFYRSTPHESLLVLQAFIGVTVAMSLILAAAVAERARAEQELRESEQRFRATFEQAAVGIAHVAPSGSWLRVNQRLCEIVGYTREELLQRTFQEITHPDDLDVDLLYVEQMLANEITTYSLEKRYIRKDGSLVWINLTVSLVPETRAEPAYFIAVIEDITQRKRADAALRESEERFAKAFRASPVAMVITRVRDNCFIDVNERFSSLLGYSRETVIGRSSLDLNLLADSGDRATRVRIMREQGWVRDYETIVRSRSGELHAVLLSIEAIELSGEPCYLTVLVDIADRKRAEQALQHTADRLRQLREIDRSMLAGRSLTEIAQATVGFLWKLLACTRVSVMQVDTAARTLTLFATRDKGELRMPVGFQAPLEILGPALEPLTHGQLYQVPDVAELAELPPALQAARVEHVRRYCYVPIVVDAELIGMLGLGWDAPGLFSAEQLDISREAADQLSIAMQQARLRDQLQRHAAGLEQRVAERTAELQHTTARLGGILDIADDAIIAVNARQEIELFNKGAERIFGHTAQEVTGRSLDLLLPTQAVETHRRHIQTFAASPDSARRMGERRDIYGLRRDGTEFPAEASISKFTTTEGALFTVILRDITPRKQVETRLRTSLHEKEILLQEVHHRVKNNLQVIASLLRLQASSIADPALHELFRDSQNRVYAMALVHEQLYQVPDLAHVDFTIYLRELAGSVVRSYMTQNAGIELTFDTDEAVALDIDTAIPLGLILTELVSNSVKHAFRDGEPGAITIGLHAEADIVTLTVRDDGVGLPEAFDLQMTGSLGLQLVGDLTEQLGGTITIGCSRGARFQIHVPQVSKKEA